jgi:hypothetical protein
MALGRILGAGGRPDVGFFARADVSPSNDVTHADATQ